VGGILPSRGVWIFDANIGHLGLCILAEVSLLGLAGICPADAQTCGLCICALCVFAGAHFNLKPFRTPGTFTSDSFTSLLVPRIFCTARRNRRAAAIARRLRRQQNSQATRNTREGAYRIYQVTLFLACGSVGPAGAQG